MTSTREAAAVATPSHAPESRGLGFLAAVFFVSGFAALIYQIVWQRSLYAIFGINVESVTIVVTAFMVGLGVGSLVGGWLSRATGARLVMYFGLVELGIGSFGAVSLPLFERIGGATLQLPPGLTAMTVLILLLVPTALMGATLPLLVAYGVERSANVGRSVGLLYFANTLGSAVAAVITAVFLMRLLGQTGAVYVAVALNFVVGAVALALARRRKGGR